VGFTLVLLGIYVLGTLLRNNASYTPKSRVSILINAFRWLSWKIRRIFNPTTASKLQPAAESYSPKSIFLIGVIHGLGAETPSQLLLFLLAANLGGLARGFLGLGMFLVGLFAMNTLMTASAIRLFGASATKPRFMRLVIGFTAAYSLIVGAIFLFGFTPLLPPLG
jgi:high-affinity nickel-transport protein